MCAKHLTITATATALLTGAAIAAGALPASATPDAAAKIKASCYIEYALTYWDLNTLKLA
ncbi:hypothetical protein ABT299_22650 [Spirillospora sp. NPDC000708]